MPEYLSQIRNTGLPVTVLGASGFVGSHLAEYLQRAGIQPILPARGDDSIFKKNLGYVYYCIGLTADYAQRPFDTVEAHSSLLSRLLESANFERLVYLSSTRLYDFAASGNEEADIALNPKNPRHVYDLSKMLGEWLCQNTSQGKAKVARLASVYSSNLADRNFLHTTIEQALLGKSLTIDTAPDYARDYVHIDDVCAALTAILADGNQPIYNVASGQNVSNADLFAAIAHHTGTEIRAAKPTQGAKAPIVDISRLKSDFGYAPALLADKIGFVIESNSSHLPKAHAAR